MERAGVNGSDDELAGLRAELERERAARRRAEAAGARTRAELETFAATAAHDLVDPLRTISGFAELLTRRSAGQLDDEARQFLAYIVDGAARAEQLVGELLAYARAGTAELRPETLALGDVVDAVRSVLDARLRASGARLTTDAPLPSVHADRGQLGRVLQNLVANAVDYVAAGVAPRVHVAAAPAAAGFVELTVTDNGIGIPAEQSEHVFAMFTRLDNELRNPGTGIGLATCRTVVERHGGRIWVTPGADHGSVFHLTLPARHG